MNNKWKQSFIKIAEIISEHSTCSRIKVGVIIVKDNRIISLGYNGTAQGAVHCCDIFKDFKGTPEEFYKAHGEFSNENEIHAETNAIVWAARNGININNSEIFMTLSPCKNCAKLIVQSGIKSVYYKEIYDRDTSGISYLKNNNILIEKIEV